MAKMAKLIEALHLRRIADRTPQDDELDKSSKKPHASHLEMRGGKNDLAPLKKEDL